MRLLDARPGRTVVLKTRGSTFACPRCSAGRGSDSGAPRASSHRARTRPKLVREDLLGASGAPTTGGGGRSFQENSVTRTGTSRKFPHRGCTHEGPLYRTAEQAHAKLRRAEVDEPVGVCPKNWLSGEPVRVTRYARSTELGRSDQRCWGADALRPCGAPCSMNLPRGLAHERRRGTRG